MLPWQPLDVVTYIIYFAYTPQLLNHNQGFIQEYFKREED